MNKFRVEQIDHVELYVPDRYEAAKWYEEVLGLEIVRAVEDWATEGGPLMISSDGGSTKLALFEGKSPGFREPIGFRRVAFRTDGEGFIAFLNRLENLTISNDSGQRLRPQELVDHNKAFSIYFSDPYGNRFEVTTYDYEHVALNRRRQE